MNKLIDPGYLSEDEQPVLSITNPIRGIVEFEVFVAENIHGGYCAQLYTLDGRLVYEVSDPKRRVAIPASRAGESMLMNVLSDPSDQAFMVRVLSQ